MLEDRLERMIRLITRYDETEDLPIAMALCNAIHNNDMVGITVDLFL